MGTFGMFTTTRDYEVQKPTSQFFASQLINTEWVQPGNGVHQTFSAASNLFDAAGHSLVTAYALLRPDGQWSVMLINRDQENAHTVRIQFDDSARGGARFFAGPVSVMTFGSAQYQWHPTRQGGFPDPDGPAAKSTTKASPDTAYELPKASMTVMRGAIAQAPAPVH
jgi:hypothetical protein